MNLDDDDVAEMVIKLPGVRAVDPTWMRFNDDKVKCGKPLT